jgi:AcrR family transcriptional regulator
MAVRRDRTWWEEAILQTIAADGVGAVAVEPLAERLGVTKGSFYWHFSGRDDALAAAMRRWEDRATPAPIDELAALDDPAERLRRLLDTAFVHPDGSAIEASLLAAAATNPIVGAAVTRVSRLRLAYLKVQFRALGYPAAEASRRALAALSAYLGHIQLRALDPDLVPSGRAEQNYLSLLARLLQAP